jgi:hypothetical protein
MNPITSIAPVTDQEAARMARPDTLSDLARQITATPVTTSHGAPAGNRARTRRRLLLLGVPLGAGLAAAAVVLAAIGVPGARHDGTDLTAYVVQRVDRALSVAGPGEIAQVTITTSSGPASDDSTATTTSEEWSNGDQWRSVTYSPAGHPVYDSGSSASSVYTLVSYQARTWARQPGLRRAAPARGSHSCEPTAAAGAGRALVGVPGTGAATDLRTAVSCGALAVAGQQRVDGIEAIELTSSPGSPASSTIWVSPDTYLPVRIVIRSAPGQPVLQQTADITWLAPTARNLARLTVPIPAGFRQLPLAQLCPSAGVRGC